MAQFRCKYTYEMPFSYARHQWTLVGAQGGIHLHITMPPSDDPDQHISAGLEAHYRTPPDYMADQAPMHDECWLLKCPCWHDGTSLYAHDVLLPFWLQDPHDHERMFRRLHEEYHSRFGRRTCTPVAQERSNDQG